MPQTERQLSRQSNILHIYPFRTIFYSIYSQRLITMNETYAYAERDITLIAQWPFAQCAAN